MITFHSQDKINKEESFFTTDTICDHKEIFNNQTQVDR